MGGHSGKVGAVPEAAFPWEILGFSRLEINTKGTERRVSSREKLHFFELFLALNHIERRRTEIRSPETNGCCERFHRTVKEELLAVAFRKTFYESLDQLQANLDRCLDYNDRERAHQGCRRKGRTP